MRIYFDTEFIEDGRTIDLISIGMVRADGKSLYLESSEADLSKADAWVRQNVLPHLHGGEARCTRAEIAERVRAFVGPTPEFWAYFADYDWVALCHLYGRMTDLPAGWPMFCLDIKQELHRFGLTKPDHIINTQAHHALMDAEWARELYLWIECKTRGWSGQW